MLGTITVAMAHKLPTVTVFASVAFLCLGFNVACDRSREPAESRAAVTIRVQSVHSVISLPPQVKVSLGSQYEQTGASPFTCEQVAAGE